MEKEKNAVTEGDVQQQQKFVECSINELRTAFGLNPINDEACNVKYLIERDLISCGFGIS
jgi:hypothetical protein